MEKKRFLIKKNISLFYSNQRNHGSVVSSMTESQTEKVRVVAVAGEHLSAHQKCSKTCVTAAGLPHHSFGLGLGGYLQPRYI